MLVGVKKKQRKYKNTEQGSHCIAHRLLLISSSHVISRWCRGSCSQAVDASWTDSWYLEVMGALRLSYVPQCKQRHTSHDVQVCWFGNFAKSTWTITSITFAGFALLCPYLPPPPLHLLPHIKQRQNVKGSRCLEPRPPPTILAPNYYTGSRCIRHVSSWVSFLCSFFYL